MIADNQTNFLFLADTLPKNYPGFYQGFKKILDNFNTGVDFLPQTKDIWAVDYMPVQVEIDKFVRFTYNPSYLQPKKFQRTISDVDTICEQIGIKTTKTNIILDGGNITRTENKVIMTDRVFTDNPNYDRKQLIKTLYEVLQVDKLFFIPEQPDDFTGHSDGMVRFLDDQTIIINDYRKEKEEFYRAFEIAIHNTGLNYIKIPYNPYGNDDCDQANGDYINYFQMENMLIIPTFGIAQDEEVVKQFEQLFLGNNISTIDSNEIANEGGVLNCITWNIKRTSS